MATLTGAGPTVQAVPSRDYWNSLTPELQAVVQAKAFEAYLHNDIFADLSGPKGSNAPIHRWTESGKGLKTQMGRRSRFGQKTILGDQTLTGTEEAMRLGTYSIQLDFRRHASSYTEKQIRELAGGGSLIAAYIHEEGRYAQERMAREILLRYRHSATSWNTRYVGQSSFGSLVSANVLDKSQVLNLSALGRQLNITQVELKNRTRSDKSTSPLTRGNMIIAPNGSLINLKQDAATLDLEVADLTNANGQSVALRGGYLNIDGHIVNELPTLIDDAEAAQSWALEPIGFLGTNATGASTVTPTVTPSDSSWTMYGTRSPDRTSSAGSYNFTNNTAIPYFQDFLGVNFAVDENETLTTSDTLADVSSGSWFYICIYNHVESSAGAGDAGKMCFYRYRASDVANGGNTIVFPANSRLSAATTTLGGMAYGSGPFASKIATAHPVGAYIFQVNRKGTPVCFNLFTGPGSMNVAFNEDVGLLNQKDDYNHRLSVRSQFVFGHSVCKNRNGAPERYMLVASAYRPFGLLDYPTVT
jgi:hypothetical protein